MTAKRIATSIAMAIAMLLAIFAPIPTLNLVWHHCITFAIVTLLIFAINS